MSPYSLSIIIPAYNESRRLPKTVRRISEYLSARREPFEVIVVDDGSRDETPELLESLKEELGIKTILSVENRGKGAALREGVMAAEGELVLMTDADLSTPIEEVHKLVPRVVRDGFDVAIGSRAAQEAVVRGQPWYRQVLSSASNALIRAVLGLPFRDTQCGFKLYRREAAVRLFSPLKLLRFSFDYEVLLRAKKAGIRVAEVGVRWEHSPFSTVRTVDVMQCLVDVFRVRFAMREDGRMRLPSLEVMRFIAVGLVNTSADTSVYLSLTRLVFYLTPVPAKFVAFIAASACSFFLNRHWTFGIKGRPTLGEFARFYAAASVGLVVNVSSMWALTAGLHIYDLLALALTTVATFAVNYTLAKLWVFKSSSALAAATAL